VWTPYILSYTVVPTSAVHPKQKFYLGLQATPSISPLYMLLQVAARLFLDQELTPYRSSCCFLVVVVTVIVVVVGSDALQKA